jgi:co-chaperonin GroES (HSP10)
MLQMLRDRILVKPLVRSLSDVLIVKNSEKLNQGEVIACGPLALDLQPGDQIKYGLFDFPVYTGPDGVTYQILQEADVAAVVED